VVCMSTILIIPAQIDLPRLSHDPGCVLCRARIRYAFSVGRWTGHEVLHGIVRLNVPFHRHPHFEKPISDSVPCIVHCPVPPRGYCLLVLVG
jgi:hypothetical protein